MRRINSSSRIIFAREYALVAGKILSLHFGYDSIFENIASVCARAHYGRVPRIALAVRI